MKLPSVSLIDIKSIASHAVFVCSIGLFSLNIHAQTAVESLALKIEESASRIAPLRVKTVSPAQKYALEKAQCWLEFGRHEELRNNPTKIASLAHAKAVQLISGLEGGVKLSDSDLDSELIKNGVRMRNDLWTQLDVIKTSSQASCAAKALACGEVMLVQAAHAHERIDWRYAQPYFGMAEDWVRTAKRDALSCPAR